MKILTDFKINFKNDTEQKSPVFARKYENLAPLKKDTVSFGANCVTENESELKSARQTLKTLEENYEKTMTEFNQVVEKYGETLPKYIALKDKTDKTQQEEEELEKIKNELDECKQYMKKHPQGSRVKLRAKMEAYKKYCAQLELNPRTSFLYDPSVSMKNKTLLAKQKGILVPEEFAAQTGISENVLNVFLQNNKLDFEEVGSSKIRFIDSKADKNQAFVASIEPFLDRALTPFALGCKYGLQESIIAEMFRENELKIIGFDGTETKPGGILTCLIDPLDEDNIRAFEQCAKLNYHQSKYYDMVGQKGSYLSANYLSGLGFGTVKDIREAIQKGLIEGKIEKVETPKGAATKTMVDVSDRTKLRALFQDAQKSGVTQTLAELSKKTGLSQVEIRRAVEEGRLEIISEYLLFPLEGEKSTKYFDMRNPKNQAFLEIREKELARIEEQNAKRREENKILRAQKMKAAGELNSLRMSVVWVLCPKTKQTGSRLAKPDGYLCSLLKKEDEGKKLSQKEQIIVNTYRKEMWLTQGTDEYKAAHEKANEYLKLYAQGGLEAIDNEDVKQVFRLYFDED